MRIPVSLGQGAHHGSGDPRHFLVQLLEVRVLLHDQVGVPHGVDGVDDLDDVLGLGLVLDNLEFVFGNGDLQLLAQNQFIVSLVDCVAGVGGELEEVEHFRWRSLGQQQHLLQISVQVISSLLQLIGGELGDRGRKLRNNRLTVHLFHTEDEELKRFVELIDIAVALVDRPGHPGVCLQVEAVYLELHVVTFLALSVLRNVY